MTRPRILHTDREPEVPGLDAIEIPTAMARGIPVVNVGADMQAPCNGLLAGRPVTVRSRDPGLRAQMRRVVFDPA